MVRPYLHGHSLWGSIPSVPEQYDFALVNGRVVLPGGVVECVNVGIRDGKVAALTDAAPDAEETLDVVGLTILPGLVDEHFHVFHGYGWETYPNATRAAAKGGITTVVDMPLDNPPTLTAQALRDKLEAIDDECYIDYAAFGGYLESDPEEIASMAAAGAVAFKLFTGGVAPPGMYPGVTAGQMLDAMRRVKREERTVVVHAENAPIVDFETARLKAEGRTDVAAWDEARPWFSELEAVQRVSLLAEVTGCRTVIAHVTAPQSVVAVRAARRRGADVWVETCPHYLCLTLEEMAGDSRLKWNPPSRDRASVDELWRLLRRGHVHTIGSDHAPLPKDPDADVWTQLPGAGNGLETMLPIVGTEALHRRDVGLGQLVDLLATTPARVFGLYPRKGTIRIGSDADFAVVETAGRRILDAQDLEYHEQPKWSPFDGREVRVYPVYTLVRGRVIFAEGAVVGEPGFGELLARQAPVAA
jgi:allantoinase